METVAQKWEYAAEQPENFEALQAMLAEKGAAGWELVSVVAIPSGDGGSVKTLRHRGGQWYAFFKRPM